jgi:hypothetical protein
MVKIAPLQKSVITGLMLGDCSIAFISTSKNAYLIFAQSKKHFPYF